MTQTQMLRQPNEITRLWAWVEKKPSRNTNSPIECHWMKSKKNRRSWEKATMWPSKLSISWKSWDPQVSPLTPTCLKMVARVICIWQNQASLVTEVQWMFFSKGKSISLWSQRPEFLRLLFLESLALTQQMHGETYLEWHDLVMSVGILQSAILEAVLGSSLIQFFNRDTASDHVLQRSFSGS
jgi:hypothetical protein